MQCNRCLCEQYSATCLCSRYWVGCEGGKSPKLRQHSCYHFPMPAVSRSCYKRLWSGARGELSLLPSPHHALDISPKEESTIRLLSHLGASVNSPCLDRSSCGLLGWFSRSWWPRLWLSVQNKGRERSGYIAKAYSVDWTLRFARLMRHSESYCSSHTEIPFCYSCACIPNSLVISINQLLSKARENHISRAVESGQMPPFSALSPYWHLRHWHCDNHYEEC